MASGAYRCIPYSAEFGKWNVAANQDFSSEIKCVVWWAETITPELWLATEHGRDYGRCHYKPKKPKKTKGKRK